MDDRNQLSILQDYAAGRMGTREAIERLGFDDYADLVIALSANDLMPPKPRDSMVLNAHRKRARAILMPRLRHGA